MASKDLADIIRRAETLSPQELLQLISYLAERAQQAYGDGSERRRWSEISGAAPLLGEDAQDWVSRSREESDSGREQHRNTAQ